MADKLVYELQDIKEDRNTNLKPENLKAGVTCLGVVGTLQPGINTSDATATAEDISLNKTAYANGQKITGSLPLFPNSRTFTVDGGVTNDAENNRIQISTINSTKQTLDSNLNMEFNGAYSDVANAVGLTPEKLVKGNTVLGVEGTAEAGGTTINNQDKTITSNGQYTADEGYTGLGTVTVQVPQEGGKGDVKLFETEEEMQADSTAKEGDLAVVYREEIQNMTADTQTQYITFPETVTLPEAFTDSFYGMLRAVDESVMFDGQVMLNQSTFEFNGYTNTGMISVSYTSNDGITYNRDIFTGDSGDLTNPVDLGAVVKVYMPEEWNDTLGYFMQIGGNVFDGLYEYGTYIDYFKVYMYRNLTVSDENVTYDSKVPFDFNTIENVLHTFMEDNGRTVNTHFLITLKNDIVKLYYDYVTTSYPGTTYYYLDGNNWYASYEDGSSFTKCTKHIEINLSDLSIQFVEDDGQLDMTSDSVCVLYYYQTRKLQDTLQMIFYVNSHSIYFDVEFAPTSEYIIADNQYTLASPNQLLPDISAYGKNGNVTGDGSITNAANSFADIPAMLYSQIQAKYDNMEPRVLTDEDKEIDDSIYIIPTKSDGTPLLDTSNVTNMRYMFRDCTLLTAIPQLNTSNVSDMYGVFHSCTSLITISQLDTSDATNMSAMFYGCSSLTAIPQLNTSNVTGVSYTFLGCDSLSNDSLNNILAMLTNAIKITSNKTLKYVGLSAEQATTCTTLSNWTACEAAGWTTGY